MMERTRLKKLSAIIGIFSAVVLVAGSIVHAQTSNSRGLTGTYRLNESRSERIDDVITDAGNISDSQRAELEDALAASEQLAIDVRGNRVTVASTDSPTVTFDADGRIRNENNNGRNLRVRAALRGQELTVSNVDGRTDFTVIFAVTDGGRTLKVTRRMTTDYLSQTLFVDSFYDKTDAVARLDIGMSPGSTNTSVNYPEPNDPVDQNNQSNDDDDDGLFSSNDPDDVPNGNTTSTNSRNNPRNTPVPARQRTGEFIVPNGVAITGVLESMISTKVSQENDRFRITVQSPEEYRGAVIDGFISGINRSGRVSGSSRLTFNFERIVLRNGKTYEFAGNLQSVTDATGKVIRIDSEGTAKGDSQTRQTTKRAGIGAGAGAIIGAIFGGAKGAAIGAVIGGGAGAGSVIAQGKEDLELPKGSTVTVLASSPNDGR